MMEDLDNWEGRNLFCGCNAEWSGAHMKHAPDDDSIPLCAECGYYPWYYLDPADEPKELSDERRTA